MTNVPSPGIRRLDEPARHAALLATYPALAALAPRYEILREVGAGGMGYVFQVRDRETGDVLALKMLRPEIARDAAMAERFKNELRLARRITHKNVCRIYDFNRIDSLVVHGYRVDEIEPALRSLGYTLVRAASTTVPAGRSEPALSALWLSE